MSFFNTVKIDENFNNTQIAASDSGSIDAFGRWRTSSPLTLFDSKQHIDNLPLFWDDQQVSGTAGSSHSANRASTTLSVNSNTAGVRVRQTFERFNYQPGKSHNVIFTFVLGAGGSGITKRVGYFDDSNGLFLEQNGTGLAVGRRTNITGTPADTLVYQSDWNIDPMDGNGPSGITLDVTKAQIFFIDFEWLGVGRVRYGFVIDGLIYYIHQILNANNFAGVYMSTPNLPCRYEIINSGTGAANTLECICTTVISEGGLDPKGTLFSINNGTTFVNADLVGTNYALLGIRLKTSALSTTIRLARCSINSVTNDAFIWQLSLNPTVGGTFNFADVTNSSCQAAYGAAAGTNTVTGGTVLDSGYGTANAETSVDLRNARNLGANIAGTADRIVLSVIPLSTNLDIYGSISWLEL